MRTRKRAKIFACASKSSRLEREEINAKLLGLVALITLALAPVALLLMIQIKFLPYHSEWVTWLHRGLLALDLALVWTLWPAYRSGWGVYLRPNMSWRLVSPAIGSAAVLTYAVMVATFPDERMYLATDWLHGSNPSASVDPLGLKPFVGLEPFTGLVLSRKTPNLYALIAPINTLDLHGEDLTGDAKRADILDKIESSADDHNWVATLSLAGRDLTGADLNSADVRHIDFSRAILNRAHLESAWANNARYDGAQLQGASLEGAQLQDASFYGAQLQGASLNNAQLQGSSLDRAVVQGASLHSAQLQGASLWLTELQGTTLDFAQLQGASLKFASLQGASFFGAQLQGASLFGALLQGASFYGAQIQGTTLDFAQLQSASFHVVCIWRADARKADWGDSRVSAAQNGLKGKYNDKCDWSANSFVALKQLIAEKVPNGPHRRFAMERIEQRLDPDPTKTLEGEDEMAKIWSAREDEDLVNTNYEISLARQWRELGCAAEGAPYVPHGLVAHLSNRLSSPFNDDSDAAKALAADFLDEGHCAGAHGLSEADKAELKKIRDTPPPQAPKP